MISILSLNSLLREKQFSCDVKFKRLFLCPSLQPKGTRRSSRKQSGIFLAFRRITTFASNGYRKSEEMLAGPFR